MRCPRDFDAPLAQLHDFNVRITASASVRTTTLPTASPHHVPNLAASHFSGPGFNVEAGLRDNIAAEMTKAQINEAQRLAREWRPK
jgi:hypothetical protein